MSPISHLPPDNAAFAEIAAQLAADELPAGWELVSRSGRGRVARQVGSNLYYKDYTSPSPAIRWLRQPGGGSVRRTRRQHELLRLSGFNAPEVLATGRACRGVDYIITTAVEGESTALWLRRTTGGEDPASRRLRRDLLRALGTFVGRLHSTGFIHGKLTPENILTAYRGGRFYFALVGNEAGRLQRPPAGKRLLRELAQLSAGAPEALTRADRWRFFLAWRQQHPELGHLEARLLAAQAYAGG